MISCISICNQKDWKKVIKQLETAKNMSYTAQHISAPQVLHAQDDIVKENGRNDGDSGVEDNTNNTNSSSYQQASDEDETSSLKQIIRKRKHVEICNPADILEQKKQNVTAKTDDAVTTAVNASGSLASTRQQEAVIDNGSLPPDIEETLAELHPDAKCDILVDAIDTFGENLILSDEVAVNSLLQIAANMNPHWFESVASEYLEPVEDEADNNVYANNTSAPIYQLPRGPTTGPGVTADDPVNLLDSDDDDSSNNGDDKIFDPNNKNDKCSDNNSVTAHGTNQKDLVL